MVKKIVPTYIITSCGNCPHVEFDGRGHGPDICTKLWDEDGTPREAYTCDDKIHSDCPLEDVKDEGYSSKCLSCGKPIHDLDAVCWQCGVGMGARR